ncbi:MAG: efflux RND transporter permease subunit [Capsulimonadaceae bacterium]
MWVTRLAITRPIAILMMVFAFLTLGFISYMRLPAELNPNVDFGVVSVVTTYPGTNPQEMETLITKPIEDSISSVSGLKELDSTSQEGISTIRCQLYIGTNVDAAAADIRDKVDAVRQQLPTAANSPVVNKQDSSSQPVMYLAMSGNRTSEQLRTLADNVVSERLAQAPDVSSVTVFGGDQREIHVDVLRDRLEAYGITISDLLNSIEASNVNVAAGYIQKNDLYASVRFIGEFANVDELKNLWITLPPAPGVTGGGVRSVRLSDIAQVTDTVLSRTQASTIDGRDTVTLVVQKTSDGNTLNACNGIRAEMKQLTYVLPRDIKFTATFDASKNVSDNLRDVRVSLCLGACLAVLIVFIFLHNLRATIIIAIAIPTCLIATFLPIASMGFTLNTMTLLGLSLAVGILIDDSIVVLENIVRHLQQGEDPITAAIKGRTEIGLAALTLTMVDLVVFVPIAFMGGIIGQFFRSFGASISIAVLFSLFVSFTLTPMLASRWFHKGEVLDSEGEGRRGAFAAFDRGYTRMRRNYRTLLKGCLQRPWTIVILGNSVLLLTVLALADAGTGTAKLHDTALLAVRVLVIGLIATFWRPVSEFIGNGVEPVTTATRRGNGRTDGRAVPREPWRFSIEPMAVAGFVAAAMIAVVFVSGRFGHQLGFRFAPGQDQNLVQVNIEAPAGSSLSYTSRIAVEVERRMRAADSLKGDIKYILTSVGQSGATNNAYTGTQYANLQVSLYDKASPLDYVFPTKGLLLRHETDAAVAAKIRGLVNDIPGAIIQATEVNGFGGGGAPLQINIIGVDFNQLLVAADRVKAYVSTIKGVYNTDLSFKASQPELQIRLDRTLAAHYGLSLMTVANAVSTAMQGDITSKYRDPSDGQQYNIRVELGSVDRNNLYDVGNIVVGYQGADPVHLRDVSNIRMDVGPTRVDRLNRLREISVTGYLMTGTQIGNVRQETDPTLQKMFAAPDMLAVQYTWGGEAQSLSDEGPFMAQAVFLGVVLSYMLMAALFNNTVYPLSVMLTLPQALVGALIALYIANMPMSLIAMIGVIMLNGLAAKNAILMVDYTNTLRSRGYRRIDALLEAAPTRLRPILMTSTAIIGASLPTALALGRGGGFRQSLGVTVVGGVAVSTVLTLFVIPCVYLLFDNLSRFVGRLRGQGSSSDDDVIHPTPPVGNGHLPGSPDSTAVPVHAADVRPSV